MKKENILRAWKDEDYYLSLSDEQRSALPANPAGAIELKDGDLSGISGGTGSTNTDCTFPAGYCNSNRPLQCITTAPEFCD